MTPVTVWTVPVDRPALPLTELRRWLVSEEIARADALRRPADRASFIIRRSALRRVLATELDCAPASVVLARTSRGKPYIRDQAAATESITFSVSSCPSTAVIAVAREFDVGVDIEDGRAADYISETTSVMLSPSERRLLAKVPLCARRDVLLGVWTRKEAVLKALGTGLFRQPDELTLLEQARDHSPVFADVVESCAVRAVHWQEHLHLAVAVHRVSPDFGLRVELTNLDRPDEPVTAGASELGEGS